MTGEPHPSSGGLPIDRLGRLFHLCKQLSPAELDALEVFLEGMVRIPDRPSLQAGWKPGDDLQGLRYGEDGWVPVVDDIIETAIIEACEAWRAGDQSKVDEMPPPIQAAALRRLLDSTA